MNEILFSASPWIGAIGAVLTTICWLPQAARVVRHKDTSAISLTANLMFWRRPDLLVDLRHATPTGR